MTKSLPRTAIVEAFVAACNAELRALKPGNVHVHAAGHRMQVRDFEKSAQAAAPHIANSRLRVGGRIRRAIEATLTAVGCNTNLGIVLLCAPLAAAAEDEGPLRDCLVRVLDRLDQRDAANVFEAIRRVQPAGLGRVTAGDVAGPATMTLLAAMGLAARRDRIARAYVTAFADVFEFGLPRLAAARRRGAAIEDAVTSLHMGFLARFPDSHIARKHGRGAARMVKAEAKALAGLGRPPITPAARAKLMAFDVDLKRRGLNPGTTADFVVATLFAETINSQRPGLGNR